ncbi:uncharacterized protein LOC133779214 [Humulus lupulus]|uniref:uncharacterized protein LOC133779214 n=1 Tax=Humulus lupulus TaxID=3486 RepID=UPI002B404E05|nr:uncharacterized protein LOC133779214 [Humulus lupulus]
MAHPPILSKPMEKEPLLLYMAIFENAISVALVREEGCVQHPVYYVSKRLLRAESRYLLMENLTFCLMVASQKLRPYFQAHPIKVLTNHPLRQVLQKSESSRRLLNWIVKLSQFDIAHFSRTAIKGQALENFIAECTGNHEESMVHNTLRFGFDASNNEVEYEALIVSLRVALELKAEGLKIFSVSQLVVNQDKKVPQKLLYQAPCYIIMDDKFYRQGYSLPLLRCVYKQEANMILREVHEGFCEDNARGQSLAKKILRQGYFLSNMNRDAMDYVKKCDKCQRFANIPRAPPNELTQMTRPSPFAVWGIYLIGSLPKRK